MLLPEMFNYERTTMYKRH